MLNVNVLAPDAKRCGFEECDRAAAARGYCMGHYQQWKGGRELKPLHKKGEGPRCMFNGCKMPSRSLGLCSGHYGQKKRGKPLTPLKTRGGNTRKYGPKTGHLPLRERIDAACRRDEETGCLVWERATNSAGSPVMTVAGQSVVVNRPAFNEYFDAKIESEHVMKACGNPACLEPAHMYVRGFGKKARWKVLDAPLIELRATNMGQGETDRHRAYRVATYVGGVMVFVSGQMAKTQADRIVREFYANVDRYEIDPVAWNAWLRTLTQRREAKRHDHWNRDAGEVRFHPIR